MYRFRCYDNSAEREMSASALYTLYAWFLNYSVENGLGETNFKDDYCKTTDTSSQYKTLYSVTTPT